MRTSQDTQRCTLDTVTRLAALTAFTAAIPLLGLWVAAVVRNSDRKPATTSPDPAELVARLQAHLMPYGGYPQPPANGERQP